MKKKIILAIVIFLLLMYLLPQLITLLTFGLDGMGFLLLLIFILNPIISIAYGIYAGKDIKKLWWFSLLIFIGFPILYWIALQDIVVDLFIYSLVYTLIEIIAMFISSIIRNKREKKDAKKKIN